MIKFFCLLAGLVTIFATSAYAESSTIDVARVRVVAPMTAKGPGAIFLSIHNAGVEDDDLLSVTTSLCGRAELHDHIEDNGVMKMRRLDKVTIPAHNAVNFIPMGKHIMCFEPSADMKAGMAFDMTLTFVKAGPVHIKTAKALMKPETKNDTSHKGHH
jgi:periplasmic copper chaperone A